jgi:hypothetical protein
MKSINTQLCAVLLGSLFSGLVMADSEVEFELSGKLSLEARGFIESPAYEGQHSGRGALSLAFEPDMYWAMNNGDDTVTFKPFFRLDQQDNQRTHADIRELSWTHLGDGWELRSGLRKVFWGVTEFQHLVDVINQSDAVEDIDSEDKLGQPMLNLSLVRDWGIVDLYLLPGFREQTFAGRSGRLRAPLVVDTDNAQYEAGNKAWHTDLAVRWSHSVGDFDLGTYWFRGTQRTPDLSLDLSGPSPILIPTYVQMNQFGFDLQATLDSWLWKAELIWRDTDKEHYWASQAGFEYTFYGIADSDADLGVLLEYGWDQRGEDATALFQNDISAGARITLNDANSTEFLAGFIHDLDYHSTSFQVEASRRIGSGWKVSVDGRFFAAKNSRDPLSALDDDSHIQLTLDRYF